MKHRVRATGGFVCLLVSVVMTLTSVPASALDNIPDWTGESNQMGAAYGVGLARAGNVDGIDGMDTIVGAPTFSGPEQAEGRAYLYLDGTGLGWTGQNNQAFSLYGFSVSAAGDVNNEGHGDVLVGANAFDTPGGLMNAGRVYLYLGSTVSPYLTLVQTIDGTQSGAQFGYSVSEAGDVNHDGYPDVIIGAPYFTNGQTEEGRVYLYLGHPSMPYLTFGGTWEIDQEFAHFGLAVSGVQDVDGDFYADVVVGAPNWESSVAEDREGRAYLYRGMSSAPYLTLAWTAEGDQANALFGVSVSYSSVNGGSRPDVIIGASGFTNVETEEGRVFVYYGQSTAPYLTLAWTAESNQANAHFGASVSNAFDVLNDGFWDIIVGAPHYNSPEIDEGAAFIWFGSSTGLGAPGTPLNADWTAQNNQASSQFGVKVAGAGNVNFFPPFPNDHHSDVLVSANFFDGPEQDEGRAYLYYG